MGDGFEFDMEVDEYRPVPLGQRNMIPIDEFHPENFCLSVPQARRTLKGSM